MQARPERPAARNSTRRIRRPPAPDGNDRIVAEQQLAAGRVFLAAGLISEAARAFERASRAAYPVRSGAGSRRAPSLARPAPRGHPLVERRPRRRCPMLRSSAPCCTIWLSHSRRWVKPIVPWVCCWTCCRRSRTIVMRVRGSIGCCASMPEASRFPVQSRAVVPLPARGGAAADSGALDPVLGPQLLFRAGAAGACDVGHASLRARRGDRRWHRECGCGTGRDRRAAVAAQCVAAGPGA